MDILTVDYNTRDAGKVLVQSLHETGFAVLKSHPIDYAVVQKIFAEWKEFFKSDNKNKYIYNKKAGDGYIAIKQSELAKGATFKDIKEFYQLYFPWGRYPEELSNNTINYFKQIYSLAKQLLGWIEEHSPSQIKEKFSESLTTMVSHERTMLRVLHYPALQGLIDNNNKDAIRAAPHEDINLITLLPASDETGLQVKTKNNTWLDVGTNAGEIVINAGDMLQEISQFYYISTTHRVINPKNNNISRMSIPLFLHPREDVFLSEKYPQSEKYLNERLSELGLLG